MRHGLLAIDVFARGQSVDHHLLMPMIGYSNDDGVDSLVVQQLLIAAGSLDWFSGDFGCQFMTVESSIWISESCAPATTRAGLGDLAGCAGAAARTVSAAPGWRIAQS